MVDNVKRALDKILDIQEYLETGNDITVPKTSTTNIPLSSNTNIIPTTNVYSNIVVSETKEILPEHLGPDIQSDYELTRTIMRNLVIKGNGAIDEILKVAKESEHPRAYEVASGLIKNIAETTKELLGTHATLKDLKKVDRNDAHVASNRGNNISVEKAVFVGNATDLIRQIKQEKAPIDIVATEVNKKEE